MGVLIGCSGVLRGLGWVSGRDADSAVSRGTAVCTVSFPLDYEMTSLMMRCVFFVNVICEGGRAGGVL